ncbi:transposase [Streptomyces sp. NPDC059832]|uniref:transposase n=1 Tax=Streptomyces sp. NPDC059832 TaxID=3346966 RepID=UPI003669074D
MSPHDSAQTQVRLETVSHALDLLARMPMLALTGDTRHWEPKKLQLRLFSAPAQLVSTGRRRWIHLPARWPRTDVITDAIDRLQALPNPADQPIRPSEQPERLHRDVESEDHPMRRPGPQPAVIPQKPHPAAESPSANRRGLMNDRGQP